MAELASTTTSHSANLEAMALVVRGYQGKGGEHQPDWSRLLDPQCVYEDWSLGRIEGAEEIRRSILEPYVDSFADPYHEIEELVSDANRLVIVGRFVGRFVREYAGMAPTGIEVTWPVRDIWTFADGRIVRIDIASDTLESGRALGVVASGSDS